ncbi:MAG: SpoIIE family protein phosphatase [Oscillatoriaceae bacterium SKW80]|nr:SpoIIE family protein phosphatase [Oscillatoriaceae bacterium SKYG93]MCX8119844.1 SpoIIE family protein phosphatase [Oscillatoriaceae bacterium SKW80]MDW8452050.1 SpoIIE family protein phosphatase [Oscillatoriaceae cyanobacterium SKYGB_i_bin93]HIK27510.1 SpoIIE family protein phosphatase [Oscillatoriaceae cyanobacterium M7585_C2015_266]
MTEILVIDDDPTIRLVLTKALQKQGYNVTVAKNGQEGIEQAQQLRPALIICDWMMPQMDGLEVCRWVKKNPELSTTFFILLTARGEIEDRIIGLDTGADEFLPKPIEINELNARVRAGLRIYQLNQDLRLSKQILEADLADAADYVSSLLPPPLKSEKVTIDARFIPSKQLGGDCYDYNWLDSEHLALYLLDVAGHGVGPALLSVSVLNVLRSRSLPNTDFSQPNQVLNALNQYFQINNNQRQQYVDKYFTIWYGVYNIIQRQLVYASAGHPPAVLISGKAPNNIQAQKLKTPGLPIGMFAEAEYVSASCKIDASSTLYIFSDGVYEINQPDGNIWTIDDFIETVCHYRRNQKANLENLLAYLRTVGVKDTFDDDLSLLQIDFK